MTPFQVAKNIISSLEDCEKSSPPLQAIVQWDREQIQKVCLPLVGVGFLLPRVIAANGHLNGHTFPAEEDMSD